MINRRKFFRNTAFSAAGIMMSSKLLSCSQDELSLKESEPIDIMKEVMKYRKIGAHEHVGFGVMTFKEQLDVADKLGIDKMVVSRPVSAYRRHAPA